MQPISRFPAQAASHIRYLLADIDDTITHDGMLPASSLSAMEHLREFGIRIVPVTGRPAGWCDHIARMWPVDAVVGENGAFFMAYDRRNKHMQLGFAKSAGERRDDRQRLDQLAAQIRHEVPGAGIASDQPYRIADLAIDFCEDVPALPPKDIDRIVALFEAAGATAKVSSIHVNGWFGNYDKLSMTKKLFRDVFEHPLEQVRANCIYVGDSPNDQPMFGYFPNSVGVANVLDFELATPPAWRTHNRSAAGFAELANMLIGYRSS